MSPGPESPGVMAGLVPALNLDSQCTILHSYGILYGAGLSHLLEILYEATHGNMLKHLHSIYFLGTEHWPLVLHEASQQASGPLFQVQGQDG